MQNKIKNKEVRNIALLLWVILAFIIVVFGLIGHVGIVHIAMRLVWYSLILSFLLGTLVLLLESWVGLSSFHSDNDILDIPIQNRSKDKNKKSTDHQASGLEASIDTYQSNSGTSNPQDNNKHIEPEKAAQAIRQFLQEDEPNK